jgi:hypothetical protein
MNLFSKSLLVTFLVVVTLLSVVNHVEAGNNGTNDTNNTIARTPKETLEKTLYEYDIAKVKQYREKFCRNQNKVNKGLAYRTII